MRPALLLLIALLTGCASAPDKASIAVGVPAMPPKPAAESLPRPKVALVLGGGAARGFAHVGVIKTLEAAGVTPDIVVGTSAGAVVGALYAGGMNGFELQKVALSMDDSTVSDWSLPARGVIRGEALQNFVNRALGNRPIDALPRTLGIVATDLQSGEMIVFRRGNTGMAVRASASVPGLFQPTRIGEREYVDGGLVSPVPAKVAREMGAEVVIAVDISSKPRFASVSSTIDVLMQTFNIMGAALAQTELGQADVVIRPDIGQISGTDFQSKHLAILEGEKAAAAKLEQVRAALARAAQAGPASAGQR
jgi:NTE family protein